jgi:uncharacterized alkaline shock family protein YloU
MTGTEMTTPPSAGGLAMPARRRGVTDIADRVVAKIAGRAAGEVDGVQHVAGRGLGRLFRPSSDPAADARLKGGAATVEVTVGVVYPRPVWDTAAEVRRHVTRRLAELAGVEDVKVRVEVAELVTPTGAGAPSVI